jgi:hypothetical protein
MHFAFRLDSSISINISPEPERSPTLKWCLGYLAELLRGNNALQSFNNVLTGETDMARKVPD